MTATGTAIRRAPEPRRRGDDEPAPAAGCVNPVGLMGGLLEGDNDAQISGPDPECMRLSALFAQHRKATHVFEQLSRGSKALPYTELRRQPFSIASQTVADTRT